MNSFKSHTGALLFAAASTRVRRAIGGLRKFAGGAGSRAVDLQLVRDSSLFNSDWYLETYRDVAGARIDPLLHYLVDGWQEGRDPGPEFSTSAYLKANADVARSGVNPLVHYLEFGAWEGRASFGHRPLLEDGIGQSLNFAAPAPCLSFVLADEPPLPWRRASALNGPSALTVGEWVAANGDDPAARTAFAAAVDLFGRLSGYHRRATATGGSEPPVMAERLIDAWYANSAQLRTRWAADGYPFVVRAFQHDPYADGVISLVAECLVSSPIDPVDVHLVNAFFPVLFVLTEPEGTLRGSHTFAFPSLCRGGSHYGELLVSEFSSFGPLAASDLLAAKLLRLLDGSAHAAVKSIAVNLDNADGAGGLFQHDFRLWLQKVARIGIEVGPDGDGFLAEAVTLRPPHPRSGEGAVLVLGHDMIPTISALTEERDAAGPAALAVNEVFVPLVVSAADHSQPVSRIDVPSSIVPMLDSFPGGAAKWPRLKALEASRLPATFPSGAILLPGRNGLAVAEMFVPVADVEIPCPPNSREPISWLISPGDWEVDDLVRSIQALSLQDGGSEDALILVGRVDRRTLAVAKKHFPGRMARAASRTVAIRNLHTPLAGFIGTGVLLHDSRCAALFSSLLQNEAVATASCVLLAAAEHSKASQPAIGDAGELALSARDVLAPVEAARAIEHLWRETYPVAAPPHDLWVARSLSLKAWIHQSRSRASGEGIHVCSALLTASQLGKAERSRPPVTIPQTRSDRVTKIEAFFG